MRCPIYVAIPVYNGAGTIRKTLNNILEQTFKDFNIIIYNDGSTDNTAQILYQFQKKDSRISVVHGTTNLGRGGARNQLLAIAGEGAIAWQDADDTWAPTKLAEQVEYFEALESRGIDPARAVLISSFYKISTRRNDTQTTLHIPPEQFDARYVLSDDYARCPFQLQCTFALASVYRSCGGFDDQLNWSEDIDMALRLLSNDCQIVSHRAESGLINYHQSLAMVKGDIVAKAQDTLVERHRMFAESYGVNIDELYSKRRLSYLFSIYLANNNFAKAISTTLSEIVDVDEDKLLLASRNIVAVLRAIAASQQNESGA